MGEQGPVAFLAQGLDEGVGAVQVLLGGGEQGARPGHGLDGVDAQEDAPLRGGAVVPVFILALAPGRGLGLALEDAVDHDAKPFAQGPVGAIEQRPLRDREGGEGLVVFGVVEPQAALDLPAAEAAVIHAGDPAQDAERGPLGVLLCAR